MATSQDRRSALASVLSNRCWKNGEVFFMGSDYGPTLDLETRDGKLTGRVVRVWGVPDGYGGIPREPTEQDHAFVRDNLERITQAVQWQLDKMALAEQAFQAHKAR